MHKYVTRDILILSAVFSLALLVRVLFIFQWHATPYGVMPILDAHAYDLWAQDILHGHLMRDKAFYQSPLYPYILALIYKIFGHSFFAASLMNAFLGAFACVGLSLIALNYFGFEAALMTGLMAAFDRQLIFSAGPLMKESLEFFLTVIFLACTLGALRSGRVRSFSLSGAFLGLLVLVRGNALLLLFAVPLVASIKIGRQSLRGCLAFILITLLFMAPATLHNAIVSHDFVWLSYDGGFNFYMGNSPQATGIHDNSTPGIATDPLGEERDTTLLAEQAEGRILQPSEVSSFWRDKALAFLDENPAQSLSLWGRKLLLFWNGHELFDNYHIEFIAHNFSTILSWPLPDYSLVFLTAIFSLMAFERGVKRECAFELAVLAAFYMFSVLLFYVTDRMRLPIEAFLLPLSGAALPCALQLVRHKLWGRLTAALIMALLFFGLGLLSWLPPSWSSRYDYLSLGTIDRDLGHYQDALLQFRKGADLGIADAQNNLGMMYREGQGSPVDYAEAMKWFREAARQNNAIAEYNIAVLYHEGLGVAQDYVEARQWVQKSANHGYAPAQNNMGLMCVEGRGGPQDYSEGLEWFRKAAAQGDPNGRSNLETFSRLKNMLPP